MGQATIVSNLWMSPLRARKRPNARPYENGAPTSPSAPRFATPLPRGCYLVIKPLITRTGALP